MKIEINKYTGLRKDIAKKLFPVIYQRVKDDVANFKNTKLFTFIKNNSEQGKIFNESISENGELNVLYFESELLKAVDAEEKSIHRQYEQIIQKKSDLNNEIKTLKNKYGKKKISK